MMFAPSFLSQPGFGDGKTWLVFPDLKECEIAKAEWAGNRYQAATFTTIEVCHVLIYDIIKFFSILLYFSKNTTASIGISRQVLTF